MIKTDGYLRRQLIVMAITAMIGILIGISATALITWADVGKLQQTASVNRDRALENAARIEVIYSRLGEIEKGIARIQGILEKGR